MHLRMRSSDAVWGASHVAVVSPSLPARENITHDQRAQRDGGVLALWPSVDNVLKLARKLVLDLQGVDLALRSVGDGIFGK